MAMPESWTLKGSYFETCNCETACTCRSSGSPTADDCTVLLTWHVEEGHFGDISLNGLNTMLAVYSPCHKQEATREVALYLDERASGEQGRALMAIFSGRAGGRFAQVTPRVGDILGVRSASIDYQADGKRCSVRVGNVKELAIPAIRESTDEPITGSHASETAASDLPADTSHTEEPPYDHHRYNWDISKENGFCSRFRYTNA
jgi:hypothetical protein